MNAKFFAVICLTLAAAPARAQDCGMYGTPAAPEPAVRRHLLLTPRQVSRLPNPRILHVTGMSTAEFNAGHIPSARLVDGMAWMVDVGGNSWEVPPQAQLESLVRALAISDSQRVVLYGDRAHLPRVFLALEMSGFSDRVAVLDGGLDAWRAAGYAVVTGRAVVTPLTSINPAPITINHQRIITAAWLQSHLRDSSIALIDTRSPREYADSHISGARNLDWLRTFSSGSLADVASLRAMLRDAGLVPGKQPVLYCTVGMRAAHMYFVARYLGYDPKLYDGSFEDWTRRSAADFPITRGERP